MRLSTKYITKVLLLLIGVLGSGGVGPINNHNLNMVNFLRSQGLHALSERFLAEEIEVEQIARLTDQDLISVGVTTIGGRMRIIWEYLDFGVLRWKGKVQGSMICLKNEVSLNFLFGLKNNPCKFRNFCKDL